MAPKCAKNVRHVKVAANAVSVVVKVAVNAAIGVNAVKPTPLPMNSMPLKQRPALRMA